MDACISNNTNQLLVALSRKKIFYVEYKQGNRKKTSVDLFVDEGYIIITETWKELANLTCSINDYFHFTGVNKVNQIPTNHSILII